MPRDLVCATLGEPSSSLKKIAGARHPTDVWFNDCLRIFYGGEQPTTEYIEVSAGPGVEVRCLGYSVFSTPAQELVKLLEGHAALDPSDSELGHSYVFPALELSFWRPTLKEPECKYFSTIGIGIRGYYSDHRPATPAPKPTGPQQTRRLSQFVGRPGARRSRRGRSSSEKT